jgi:hypothetical protein
MSEEASEARQAGKCKMNKNSNRSGRAVSRSKARRRKRTRSAGTSFAKLAAKLTPEQKAALIEGARFAHAHEKDPLMSESEWAIFRDGVNKDAQRRAEKEFRQGLNRGKPQRN